MSNIPSQTDNSGMLDDLSRALPVGAILHVDKRWVMYDMKGDTWTIHLKNEPDPKGLTHDMSLKITAMNIDRRGQYPVYDMQEIDNNSELKPGGFKLIVHHLDASVPSPHPDVHASRLSHYKAQYDIHVEKYLTLHSIFNLTARRRQRSLNAIAQYRHGGIDKQHVLDTVFDSHMHIYHDSIYEALSELLEEVGITDDLHEAAGHWDRENMAPLPEHEPAVKNIVDLMNKTGDAMFLTDRFRMRHGKSRPGMAQRQIEKIMNEHIADMASQVTHGKANRRLVQQSHALIVALNKVIAKDIDHVIAVLSYIGRYDQLADADHPPLSPQARTELRQSAKISLDRMAWALQDVARIIRQPSEYRLPAARL